MASESPLIRHGARRLEEIFVYASYPMSMQTAPGRRARPRTSAFYERLKADIMTTRLTPGQALQEEDLARKLGTSRTPVREALRMLQNDGLVSITHNRGAVVTDISFRQIMEAYELRELLEPYAARLGVSRANLEEISRLEATQRRLPTPPQEPRSHPDRGPGGRGPA